MADNNASSVSTVSASNYSTTTYYNDYFYLSLMTWEAIFYWQFCIVPPFSIGLGIPMSIVIMLLMPFTKVKQKPKMFYVLFAACALGPQIFLHLFLYFNNLLYILDASYDWYFEGLAALTCQFSRFFSSSGEFEVGYLLILFAVERLVAVTFPLKVHIFTMKRSACSCAAIILVGIAFNSLNFFSYSPNPNNSQNPYCSPVSTAGKVLLLAFLINSLLPSCLLLVLAVLTFVSLQKHQKQVMKMQGTGAPKKMKGRKSTMTMLALAAIRCSVYVPQSVLYITWQFIPDPLLSIKIRILSNYFSIFSGLCSIMDFIVYVVQIPSFRKLLLKPLICFYQLIRKRLSRP